MRKNFKETSKAGAMAWFLQRITAVLLFIGVIYHFVYYHFISDGVYTWKEVVTKMQSPWFNLLQFLFLLTALYHGFNGIWMVAEDYIHGKIWRMIVFSLILLVGTALFFVGTLTIFKMASVNVGV
jgi:succinate dehydrogenase / fumarate reductase, membrane anchor subunit